MSKKLVVGTVLVVGLVGIVMAANRRATDPTASSPTPTPTTAVSSLPPEAQQIVDRQWLWTQTQMSDGAVISTDANNSFSVTLQSDGRAVFTTDCNGGNGSYTIEGNNITFGPIATTMMFCEGSNEGTFYNNISNVQSYLVQDGNLYFQIKLDSGVMEFVPPAN